MHVLPVMIIVVGRRIYSNPSPISYRSPAGLQSGRCFWDGASQSTVCFAREPRGP